MFYTPFKMTVICNSSLIEIKGCFQGEFTIKITGFWKFLKLIIKECFLKNFEEMILNNAFIINM